jgi:flagellar biosynthesis protein FlhG
MKQIDSLKNVIHLSERAKISHNINQESVIHQNTRVISVASGKGGVGKSNIVANIGYFFSKLGKKVLIFDADLGLGNMDILLGLAPKHNFSHTMTGEKKIEEIVLTGPAEMKIIPAASGIQELTELSESQQIWVLQELERFATQFDLFIFDTGAGISKNVIYFSAVAQEVIIVVSPEPTSITDAYALMKILHYRRNVNDFNLIVNMVKSQKEALDIFRQLNMVAKRFLNININYSGHVLMDEKITKCVKMQKIVSELYPESCSSICFNAIARQFVDSTCLKSSISANRHFNWKNLLSQ